MATPGPSLFAASMGDASMDGGDGGGRGEGGAGDERMFMGESGGQTPPATPTPSRRRSNGAAGASPRPPMTPNSVRAQEERLLRRGRVIADEFSQRRKKKYTFNLLPESPAKRGAAMQEESPARYSTDQVAEAVMSFADFLYFLEDKQREHPLMPVICERFAELGAVIESQKRHIDHWKQKELDLAISETQQSLDLFRNVGVKMEKLEVQLASCVVEKQGWEEKYDKCNQQAQEMMAQAEKQCQSLNTQILELQHQIRDHERIINDRNGTVARLEQSNQSLQKKVEQMESERAQLSDENRGLAGQGTQQHQQIAAMEEQIQQLQQTCEAEQRKSSELNSAVHSWEIKYQEEKRVCEHLEQELSSARKEREDNVDNMKQLIGEGGRFRADFEATAAKYEHQLQSQQERLHAVEAERTELSRRLEGEKERVQQTTNEMAELRKQAEMEVTSMRAEMEKLFTTQAARLREELGQENRRLAAEKDDLAKQYELLQAGNRTNSTQLTERETRETNFDRAGLQRIEELEATIGEWRAQCEQLHQQLRQGENAVAEALKKQGDEMESQFNSHLKEIETYMDQKSRESDELRAVLESHEDEMSRLKAAANEEVTRCQNESRDAVNRCSSLEAEYSALQREVEHYKNELASREKEIESMKEHINAYLAPNSEHSKQNELLNQERLRLEQQNQELRQQIDEAKRFAEDKVDQLNDAQLQAAEQESAHRATIVSLHHEKDDLQRALGEVSSEKSALEGHLHDMAREKESVMESMSLLERQNTELENRAERLSHSLGQAEKDKQELEIKIDRLRNDSHLQTQSNTTTAHHAAQVEQLSMQLKRQEKEMAELRKQAASQYKSVSTAEEASIQLQQQLQYRDSDLKNAKREVESSRETIQQAEGKCRQLMMELETAQSWNSRYKTELDAMQRNQQLHQGTRESELSRQCHELNSRCGELQGEVNQIKLEAEREIQRLRSAQNNRESEFQVEHTRLVDANTALQQRVQESSGALETLQGELNRINTQLQTQTEAYRAVESSLESTKHSAQQEKSQLQQKLREVQSQLQRAENSLEDFKRQAMNNVRENKDVIERVEAENQTLRTKLAAQSSRSSIVPQSGHASSSTLTNDLLQKEQLLTETQMKLRQMEEKATSLERLLQKRENSASSSEETTRKRFQREQQEMEEQLSVLQYEKDDLRQKLSASTDEIASLKRRLNEQTDDTDRARTELAQVKSEMTSRMNSLELELHQAQRNLVMERGQTRKLKDSEKHSRENIDRSVQDRSDLESLKHQLQEMRDKIERNEVGEARQKKRLDEMQRNEANLIKRLKSLQKKHDAAISSEEEMQDKLRSLVNQRENERDQLLGEIRKLSLGTRSESIKDGIRELCSELKAVQRKVREQEQNIQQKDDHIYQLNSDVRQLQQKTRESRFRGMGDSRIEESVVGSTPARSELRELRSQIEQAKEESRTLRTELEEKKAVIREMKADARKLHHSVRRREAENASGELHAELETDQDSNRSALRELRTQLESAQRQVRKQNAAVDRKDAEIQVLTSELHSAQSALNRRAPGSSEDDVVEYLHQSIEQLNEQLTELAAENDELRAELEHGSTSKPMTAVGDTESRARELTSELRKVQSLLRQSGPGTSNDNVVNYLRQNIGTMNQHLSALTTENSELSIQLNQAQKHGTPSSASVGDKGSYVRELTSDLRKLQSLLRKSRSGAPQNDAVDYLHQNIERMNQQLSDLAVENDELHVRLKNSENEVSKQTAAVHRKEIRVQELTSELRKLQSLLHNNNSEIAKDDVVGYLQQNIERLNKQLSDVTMENDDLRIELDHARKECGSQAAAMNHKDDRIRELKSELLDVQALLRNSSSKTVKDDVVDYLHQNIERVNQQLSDLAVENEELHIQLKHAKKEASKQAAAVDRKDSRVRALTLELRKVHSLLRTDGPGTSKDDIVDDLHREIERMNQQLSDLTMVNDERRETNHHANVAKGAGSAVTKSSLDAKCDKLKERVRKLREENDLLRHEQVHHQQPEYDEYEQTREVDVTKWKLQVERLTDELQEKDRRLDALRRKLKRSGSTPTASSTSTTAWRTRVNNLEAQLDDKEQKIMMLNDHLTYLMTSSIQLQHENEKITLQLTGGA